jgi:DNA-binding CsgD family transcriptional regulator
MTAGIDAIEVSRRGARMGEVALPGGNPAFPLAGGILRPVPVRIEVVERSAGRGGFSPQYLGSAPWYERLAAVFCAPSAGPALKRMIDELVFQFDVDNNLLLHFPRTARPDILLHAVNHASRKNRVEDYRNAYYLLDPFYINIGKVYASGSASLSDVIDGPFRDSEYYKFYYLDAGLLDELCFCTTDGQGGYVLLSLSRSLERKLYAEEELEAMRSIAPLACTLLREQWRLLVAPEYLAATPPVETEIRQGIEAARANFGRSLLTPRELDVLNLMLKGHSFENISRKLAIAAGTVHVHRKHIYEKLDIGSLTELFSLFIDTVCSVTIEPGQDPLAVYSKAGWPAAVRDPEAASQ